MARKVMTEQAKKKKKTIKILVCLIIIVAALVIGLGLYQGGFKKLINLFSGKDNRTVVEVKVLDSLDDYGYSLSDKDSKYYKSEYEKLKKLLNSDNYSEEEYAKSVATMFVIDLYTMDTKVNKYDVGGTEFYHRDKKSMYESKVMDTIYSTLLDDTYGDRKQSLPVVKNVEVISTEATKYLVDEKAQDGYLIQLKWTYEKEMGYDTEGSVVVCKENGIRWSVVDFQPTLNPKYE